ncbi:siderophore-interacting protein [Spongiactinospora rosea]|nr:siderophore-interacting protein [Spongiactinospora rosea]
MITLEVVRNTRLSPHFAVITLGGPELAHLNPTGFDHTVRLFFPREGQERLRMPALSSEAWMAELMLMPKSRRPWVRNYTIRRFRPEAGEVDIEFVLHGDTSPASAWASRARPGDPAGIFDIGIMYLPPPGLPWHLLVGEESALPAVLAILEDAPESLNAEVFLEVPETADIRKDIVHPEGARIHWLPRDAATAVPGALALETVRQATLPEGRFYTWVAGESRLATGLRRHLVNDRAAAKSDIAFFGYWRQGRSSPG